MQELFLQHIEQNKWAIRDQRILLTVSGGLDSMVMLHLFVSSGFQVSVAHCNFQLRGSESDGDEQFVIKKCQQLQVPVDVKRFDTNNYATHNHVSTQMAARDLRYAWFYELANQGHFSFIATAHHLNDAIETTLLNLISGRGADGLTGIAAQNGRIIRPLIFASRKLIEKYAADHTITWREDSSNSQDEYKRNFIRHRIIPLLSQLNPSLLDSVSRSMRKNEGIVELEREAIAAFESRYVSRKADRMAIDKTALQRYQHKASVLYELIKGYGFSLEQCGQMVPAVPGQPGKRFSSASHQLVIDRDELIITRHTETPAEVRIALSDNVSVLGTQRLQLEETEEVSISNDDNGHTSFDADKVNYPLTWRTWREGDFFYPLGMENRKKISDFLIDRKIPLNDKAKVTVLESKGEIMWVVGHRISHHFRITPGTKRELRIKVMPHFI